MSFRIDITDEDGRVIGRLPGDTADGLGIEVTEQRTAISLQQRRLMQAHPSYEPLIEDRHNA